jgi:hypothetical protein
MKCADAPPLDTTHLGVELALMRSSQREKLSEVRPTQLSPQCGDNCFIGEYFSKLHHSTEVLVFEPTTELAHQLSRQRGDNLLAVGCSFVPQDLPQDSVADPPIERSEADVDDSRRLPASLFDQASNLVQEISGFTGFYVQLAFRIPIFLLCQSPL